MTANCRHLLVAKSAFNKTTYGLMAQVVEPEICTPRVDLDVTPYLVKVVRTALPVFAWFAKKNEIGVAMANRMCQRLLK